MSKEAGRTVYEPHKPLSPREENFCRGLVAGLSRKAAYEAAGYTSETTTSANVQIHKLMHAPEIRFRIHWLQIRQAARLNVTIDKLILELAEAWELAEATNDPKAMIAATLAKAKLLGLLDNDRDPMAALSKPAPLPTDVVELSVEDWERQFKPKTIQ